MNECRYDERLKTQAEESTLLSYTWLYGEQEHLKIKTRFNRREGFCCLICMPHIHWVHDEKIRDFLYLFHFIMNQEIIYFLFIYFLLIIDKERAKDKTYK